MSFSVKARNESVPEAEEILFVTVVGLFIPRMRHPDIDCVVENLSALIDDHLRLSADALATADVVPFTVNFALGISDVLFVDEEVVVDDPVLNGT
jgi:hypothetical protein